jgi:hypothetical protein
MRQVVIDRRTFLQAAGLSAAGIGAAGAVLAGHDSTVVAQQSLAMFEGDPIAAQADALDYDQERIFRFVSDEIAYEPYSGVLRGPKTTLIGRSGNGADKAALLAALLQAASIETRFVTGTLDDAAAAALEATTVTREALRSRAEAALHGDPTVPAPSPPGPPDPAVQAVIDRRDEIDASVTAWASQAIDTTVRQLTEALAGAGITLPSGPAPLPESERTRHLWVQARSGSDWLDLDPTLAGAEPGVAIATLVGEPTASLPDHLRHRLEFDLVLEKIAGGGVVQETIVEHSRFADELTDVPISIGHAKPEGLQGLGSAVQRLITGDTRYVAALQVGPTTYIGLSPLIFASGDTAASTDPFAGMGPGEGEAVAEWLDLRITAPDGTVSTARRTLFDRVGEVVRLAGPVDPALIPPAELVDLPGHPHEYLPLAAARFLSVATGGKSWPSAEFPAGQEALALGIPVQMYHVTRDATNALLAPDRGVAVHLAAPNVTMHSYEPVIGPDGTIASVTEFLDLLHRGFGAVPVSGATASVPAGLLAGVTSHVAERLRGGAGLPVDLAFGAARASVGSLFEQAAAEGIGLRVLRGVQPAGLGYPPAAAARLAEALADGWVAIVPERPVALGDGHPLGWWLVDPVTGATLDQMDDGRGAVMLEHGDIILIFAAGAWWVVAWTAMVTCITGAAGRVAISLNIGATTASVAICKG